MDFRIARQALIDELRRIHIQDEKVLAAINKVPRHAFVPDYLIQDAYVNIALPIDEQQTISQPYIVARMTQAILQNHPKKVLEIGTGSGYQAAVLAEMGLEVYSIERIEHLHKKANKLLNQLGYKNIQLKFGDGYLGWEEHSPFDAIIVTAACETPPKNLLNQLKNNGQMIIPLNTSPFGQELVLITRKDQQYETQYLDAVLFVPMLEGLK